MPRFTSRKTVTVDKKKDCGAYEPPVKKQKPSSCETDLVKKDLGIVCNPFDDHANPKYPDGLAQWSVGKHHVNAEEIKFPKNKTDGEPEHNTFSDTVVVVLFAGVNNHCVVMQDYTASDSNPTGQYEATETSLILNNHVAKGGIEYKTEVNKTKIIGGAMDESDLDTRYVTVTPTDENFVAWRPVSCAMRITGLNNGTEDGGWWEAVRVDKNLLSRDNRLAWSRAMDIANQPLKSYDRPFGLAVPNYEPSVSPTPYQLGALTKNYSVPSHTVTKKIKSGNLLPMPSFINWVSYESLADWGSSQSYSTGKITDLDCVEFQLNHVGRDNEFKQIRPLQFHWPGGVHVSEIVGGYYSINLNSYVINSDRDDTALTGWADQVTSEKTSHTNMDTLVSDAFDVIMVRIHGTQGKTKLFCESVCNREYMVPENGPYAQYQTPVFPDVDGLFDLIDYRNTRYIKAVQRSRKVT